MDSNKEDVKYILELLKRYLPDFPVKRDDLLKPTPSFAISFYYNYKNILEKECRMLFKSNLLNDIVEICPRDMDQETFVFLFTRHILNKFGIQYFSIFDFYRPTNRTQTTIKACMFFLVYLKENSSLVTATISAFYEKLAENELKVERIIAKKNEISEISQNIGLIREEIDDLQKKYDAELLLASELSEKDSRLDKEICEFEKEFDSLSHNVRLQEQMLCNLKDEVHALSDQVVSENEYELFSKDRLNQIQIKVADKDRLAEENTKVLEVQHKELDRFKRAVDILKQVDISTLDKAKEIKNLEEGIRKQESLKEDINRDINSLNAILKAKTASLCSMNKKFQEEQNRMEARMLEQHTQIRSIDENIFSEKKIQEKLQRKYRAMKDALCASEKECLELENDQNLLETEHNNIYKELLTEQNLITTTFNNALEELTKRYK